VSRRGRPAAAGIRLLVLDHYFEHDIDAIRAEGGSELELRTIPFDLLRSEALRVFPEEVATGLEAYARPELEPQRLEWSRRLAALLEEQFSRGEFDAFVSPSDVFFYVRAAPEACHRLGVPFFVAQKETTISPETMESHAERVRRYAPPIADRMTVCSELHRQFWLRSGADPGAVEVTGQPRFDFYAGLGPERTDAGYGRGGPVALFFSYQVDAYHPSEGEGTPVWAELHHQTEEGLFALAERGWRVFIKPHPQQPWSAERRRIARAAGRALNDRVFLVDPGEDARRLVAGADVVVGFQTTALLESMAAGRPVVYTGWDPEAARLRAELIPFGEWSEAITVVESAGELPSAVERARESGTGTEAARQIAEQYLGPADGGASRRTIEAIRECAGRFQAARTPEVANRRETLAARRPPLALGRRTRGGLRRVHGTLTRVRDR
jgi:hypothetical protein